MFSLVVKQAILLSFRRGGGALGGLAFYVLVFTLFTFALGDEAMQQHALAVMCVTLLLSGVISQPHLYDRDYEDGTLEQYILSPIALELLVLAKLVGQWCTQLLPVLLVVPLLGVMANLSVENSMHYTLRLCLVSPSLVAIHSITAALTLGSRRGGLLPALIGLPFTIPLVIFACGIAGAGAWFVLAAFAFTLVPVSCWLSAWVLRIAE